MTTQTHDWSRNCCTNGVHHGRDDVAFYTSLSEIDLSDGAIYNMVEQAVKSDAQDLVDYGTFTQEFADLMCELWQQYFDKTLQQARRNAERYKAEKIAGTAGRRDGETMPSQNDHVNYIVRVCGQSAFFKAGDVFRAEGKPEKR